MCAYGQLVSVHLSDAHYITDASKFISVTLLALRALMALELPHVNVLSKIDLLASYGELRELYPLLGMESVLTIQPLTCDTMPNAAIWITSSRSWTRNLGWARER
jgi:hypothetical protein